MPCIRHTRGMSILSSLKLLLRPAVVFALRNGMKLQEVSEALRSVLVEAASNELARAGDKPSTSRISVMTGIQRRAVSDLLASPERSVRPSNILAKVIGQWSHDPRWSTGGIPRELGCEGIDSEFFQMVQLVTRDIGPYAVCFELERIGAAERSGDKLRLVSAAFDAGSDLEAGWTIWSRDAQSLMLAVEENLDGAEIPNLHIATRYDNVVLDALPEIRRWLLVQGAEFHGRLRDHLSRFDKDLNPSLFDRPGGGRVTLGSFSHCAAGVPVADEEKKNG